MRFWILRSYRELSNDYHPPPNIPQNRGCYRISRYRNEVRSDGMAFIWYPKSNRETPDMGVYNVSKVVSPPYSSEFEEQINAIWRSYNHHFDQGEFMRLTRNPAILVDDLYYPDDLNPPLLMEELSRENFDNLPVIRMPQRGIYRLDHNVGERLLEYIGRTRGRRW